MLQLFECLLTGDQTRGHAALAELTAYRGFSDPEGWYYWGQGAALVSDRAFALEMLQRAVSTGFACPRAFESSPLLDSLRGMPAFADVLARAREGHEVAAEAFAKADGHRLLGLPRA
jgi:hypothetical protein